MEIGAMIFATDQTIKATKLAPELESRGFESLWIPEKTHLPTSRSTPWPGGDLPEWYKRTSDPLIALAAAAGVTSRLRLGTGIALVPVHDAVIMAKSVATLDWISDGRFEFGIGYGWNTEEYATHDVDITKAPEIMREKIALMCELWQNDVGSYEGKYARVEPSWSWPKPIQQPRPPIHIGARATKGVFADIAAYADGWIPIEGYGDILSHIPKLHLAFEEAGRSISEAQISVYSSSGDPKLVEEYANAGIDRVIVALPPTDESEVMRELERHTTTLASYIKT
ncbi:MAG: TIGR03619 family F420-dependent LLM class oxidoreductase [Gammaproteobacteria bacterium]|nr:TIGR03619 family F420-dependent LLM class oxidoreductase [Gammaproteobacteria bacterium]